ncbi:hypothetical protein [Acidovorax sp. NCPPB 4044]|uniref:hypothetical protein n=1 Tax=Acidovorax sp. NCPPB 4044 TaxID=2940490 RepID=UPI002303052E|nr:hypothetical protein [Acidovorax sp. NCPPB 4044]MDA8521728.1 hypothetical protein [Acidovorax sp. NCPPB 4044]
MQKDKDTLRRNILLKKHLKNLSTILNREVSSNELETSPSPNAVQLAAKELGQFQFIQVNFKKTDVDKLKITLEKLAHLNKSCFYLWLDNSIDLGFLKINSLSDIDYFSISEKIQPFTFGLIAEDFSDYLLCDLESEEESTVITLEYKGKNWSSDLKSLAGP